MHNAQCVYVQTLMKLRILPLLLLLLSLLSDSTPLLTLYSYSYCKSLLSFERNLSLPLEESLKRERGEEGDTLNAKFLPLT